MWYDTSIQTDCSKRYKKGKQFTLLANNVPQICVKKPFLFPIFILYFEFYNFWFFNFYNFIFELFNFYKFWILQIYLFKVSFFSTGKQNLVFYLSGSVMIQSFNDSKLYPLLFHEYQPNTLIGCLFITLCERVTFWEG